MQIERLFEIVYTLLDRGTVTAQELADKLNVSKRTILRDIETLALTKIPAYSGAKAAVSNFTQWLAVHFSHIGIRVNAIAPGFFSTKQNAQLLWNADGTPTQRTGKILAATPMGRFGEVDDLVGATLFLISSAAAGFVTGVCIPIDGGFSSYSGV